CEKESRLASLVAQHAASQIGCYEASADVDQHLQQQHRPKVVSTKYGEDDGEKRGISRQAHVSGNDLARIGDRVDAVGQPIIRDIGINAGMIRYMRESEN